MGVSKTDPDLKQIDLTFKGQLDTEHPQSVLSAENVVQADNIEWLPGYGFKKRKGSQLFNSTAIGVVPIQGLYWYKNLPDSSESGTYTSQPAAAAGNDSYIVSISPTSNNDTTTTMPIGYSVPHGRRVLIKFDLSGIPATAEISSATLTFEATSVSGNNSTISLYRLKRNWVESEVTWNIYSTGNSWQTAGGGGANDIDTGTVTGSIAKVGTGTYNITLTAAEIQKLIDGTYTNYGWLVKDAELVTTLIYFATSDNATAASRPKLTVKYVTPGSGTTIVKEICGAGTLVYKSDNDGSWDDISGASSWADSPVWQFRTFNDDLCALPLGNSPMTWNGAEAALQAFGSLPTGETTFNAIEVHRGRLYLAVGSKLCVSDQDAHEVFTGHGSPADSADTSIDPNDNDIGTALRSFRDFLVVFKEYSIHRWVGSSTTDFATYPIFRGFGCISANGVVNVGSDLIFVSRQGVHSLAATEAYGDVEETFLTYPVRSDIADLLATIELNQASLNYNPRTNKLYLAIPVTGGTSYLWEYDMTVKKWSNIPDTEAWSLGVIEDPTDGIVYMYYGSNDGYVYQLEDADYDDNGSAITSTVKTPILWGDDPFVKKNWIGMHVFYDPQGASSGDITVTAQVGTSSSAALTLTQTATASAGVDYLTIDKVGNFAQFTFAHSTNSYGFEIYSARVYYKDIDYPTKAQTIT